MARPLEPFGLFGLVSSKTASVFIFRYKTSETRRVRVIIIIIIMYINYMMN